jgi:hypothetical protein
VKRWLRIVLGIVVIGAIAYCVYKYRVELGLASPESGSNAEQANSELRPAHIVWQVLDRTADGFKVEMPADTKETQIPAYNQHGGAEQVEMIYAYPGSDTTYAIAWADNPPVERAGGEVVERTLDMAQKGALARTQTTLTGESQDNRNGYPARDFSGRNDGGGVLNARLILAGTRLYMLIAAFPAASARRDQDVNRFFDSFSLTLAARND